MCVLRSCARMYEYTRVSCPAAIPFEFETLELCGPSRLSAVRLHASTLCACSAVRVKTQVYTYCVVVVPPPPNSRLGKLKRPSSRISCCLGDQVTQGDSSRPRVPGPPNSPRLLNEQVLKRKLRRSLSRVISTQVDWRHQHGINTRLLCPIYPDRHRWKGGLDIDVFETIPPKPFSYLWKVVLQVISRKLFSNDYVAHAFRCAATSEFKRWRNLAGNLRATGSNPNLGGSSWSLSKPSGR